MPQEGAIVILLASDEGVGLQRCRRSQGTSIFSNRGKQLDRVMRLGRNRRVKESNERGCAKRVPDSSRHPVHCLGWAAPPSRATTMACSVLRLSTWSSELNFRDRRIPA
jgi:hypothetical protein